LPGSCERRASEPSPSSDEVHGSRRQHVLKMRFGQPDVAGTPQVEGALLVFSGEGRLRLAHASRCKGLMFLLWAPRQKAPAALSTLWLQGIGSTICHREAQLKGSPPLPVIRKPAPALVPGRTDRDLPIPIEDEVLQGQALT
jgi:hypothetical protein